MSKKTGNGVRPQGVRPLLKRFLRNRGLTPVVLAFLLFSTVAHADVSIESSVSRARLGIGEELTYDIIVTNAQGRISKPNFTQIEGFSSYSQGQSQEISIVNGQSSSRSIFSYVLIANSEGKKMIGSFQVNIGGKDYAVPPVEVEVVRSPAGAQPSGPVYSPPPRALPGREVRNEDIFVKAWLDKDQVYVNEPATLTYTVYTRLSATYKGFDKEPATTGFWVEDFPPEMTAKKTEQFIGGQRYVVADVRKLALFPTQAGVFTIDPGTLSTVVEVRQQNDFDSFFSYNIFGRRGGSFPPAFVSQVFSKSLSTEPVTVTVKALPETGRPESFSGAVGEYAIESSIDKRQVEAGDPVTFRVRVSGRGNINTVQTPPPAAMEDFRIYDSASSANVRKERLVVEGEKTTETVLVPRKPGTYTIPPLEFSFFDPKTESYRELLTSEHKLDVRPGRAEDEEAPQGAPGALLPAEKQDVILMGRDVRYLKTVSGGPVDGAPVHRRGAYWLLNALWLAAWAGFAFAASRRAAENGDISGLRYRRSHRLARRHLKKAAEYLKKGDHDAFYAETSRSVYGYFADKLNLSAQDVSAERVEALAGDRAEPQLTSEIRDLFHALSFGRFASVDKNEERMQQVYEQADRAITRFEKVKIK